MNHRLLISPPCFCPNWPLSVFHDACYDTCMPMARYEVLGSIAVALALLAPAHLGHATGAEPGKDVQVDPAPCLAAAAANDDDKIVPLCSTLIDSEKTAKPDRIKALTARAGVFERKEMYDSAIADYDAVLGLDP